jgi:hypothetical protein
MVRHGRTHRQREVEDHHDVAATALHRGRDMGVAPVEIEAMDGKY